VNKLFLVSLISFALVASGAMALEPCPLAFSFVTSPPGANVGLNVDIKYMGNVIASSVTNEFGELVVDLGSMSIPNCMMQSFELVVKECESDNVCHRVVSFNPNGYTTIDITGIDLFKQCPVDTTPYDHCDSCCALPESCCSYKFCEDGGFIKPDECPAIPTDYSPEIIVGTIVAVLAAFGVGKRKNTGIQVTEDAKGIITTKHKHKNYMTFHDVKMVHPVQPHKAGEIFPDYVSAWTRRRMQDRSSPAGPEDAAALGRAR